MAHEQPILVTGAGGFIGSHLVEGLLRAGRRVRAFVRYASHGGTGWLEELPADLRTGCETFFGDITDARAVLEATRGCGCVFHLAALIGIPYSFVAPASYVTVNVQGTLHVLEAARSVGVERVVVASTSEVYGSARYTPMSEEHALQPQSPYAATKIGAESLALSYRASFGLPVSIVRPFNTYGPRQGTRAIIPAIVTQALYSDAIRVGNCTPVRDMLFVEDTVAGLLALADSSACVGQPTNLATGVGVAVGELVERIVGLVGRRIPVIEVEERKRPHTSEVSRLIGSATRAAERMGWCPRVDLQEGLTRTIAWFRARGRPADAGRYRI
jgi:NAD dependent epimerase/dehydratase